MRDHSYLSSIDDLKKWFDLNQAGKEPRPYFTLYRGYEAKNDRYILSNKEISEPEAAWELLEQTLEMYQDGGGQFRVFITDRPAHNFGMTTYVKLAARNPAVAGIHGVNVAPQAFGIYGSMREMFEAELSRERKMWEMEQEIEMMKAGQSGIGTVETIRQVFEAVPALNPLAHAIGMKILGMAPASASPVAGNPAPAETINGAGDAEGYDYDVVEPALDKMRRVFPNVEMTLDTLADWVNKNPEMARNLFGNLNQTATQ